MKLFYSAASPYVRKCLVAARELGLHERIELLPAAAHPVNRDRNIVAHTPLGKVPTLITDEGVVLYDSRVICEYLNALGKGTSDSAVRRPRAGARSPSSRSPTGCMDAAVLARYETVLRPEPLRWNDWITGQLEKVTSGLDEIERRAEVFGDRVDVGTIAVGCALGLSRLPLWVACAGATSIRTHRHGSSGSARGNRWWRLGRRRSALRPSRR